MSHIVPTVCGPPVSRVRPLPGSLVSPVSRRATPATGMVMVSLCPLSSMSTRPEVSAVLARRGAHGAVPLLPVTPVLLPVTPVLRSSSPAAPLAPLPVPLVIVSLV